MLSFLNSKIIISYHSDIAGAAFVYDITLIFDKNLTRNIKQINI